MDVKDWYRIFAWCALASQGAILAIWIARAVWRREEPPWSRIQAGIRDQGLALGALVAGVATAGSLYLSDGAHLTPCKLCWYQRTMMYPLAVILIVAAVRRDWSVRPYALVLSLIGAAISAWHVLVEWFPRLEGTGSCDPNNPCSALPLPRYLGYLSIPTMAGSAFLLVATLAWFAGRPDREEIS